MTKKETGIEDQYKRLHEWAKDRISLDETPKFMSFAEDEGVAHCDMLSETDFLVLKEKYELEG